MLQPVLNRPSLPRMVKFIILKEEIEDEGKSIYVRVVCNYVCAGFCFSLEGYLEGSPLEYSYKFGEVRSWPIGLEEKKTRT